MIYIKDNFLEKDLLKTILKGLNNFEEVKTQNKSFWIKRSSLEFINYICSELEIIENNDIEPILGFFREAKKNQDNTWRIHNDSIINNEQPDRAIVLYLSKNTLKKLNGTAFWEHNEYGDKYKNSNVKEFNRMLIEDAEDINKWTLRSIISHKQNRLISYPCNYFHSKYPNEFLNSRKVFVMFYKVK